MKHKFIKRLLLFVVIGMTSNTAFCQSEEELQQVFDELNITEVGMGPKYSGV